MKQMEKLRIFLDSSQLWYFLEPSQCPASRLYSLDAFRLSYVPVMPSCLMPCAILPSACCQEPSCQVARCQAACCHAYRCRVPVPSVPDWSCNQFRMSSWKNSSEISSSRSSNSFSFWVVRKMFFLLQLYPSSFSNTSAFLHFPIDIFGFWVFSILLTSSI